MQPLVIFQPSGKRIPVSAGDTLWDLALEAGVDLVSTCGGKGTCGKCVVVPQASRFDGHRGHQSVGDARDDGNGACLACQTRLPEGGTVWVPEQSRPDRQVILTSGCQLAISLNPRLRSFPVQVAPHAGESEASWEERVLEAVRPQAGDQVEVPLSVLQELPRAVSKAGGQLTVTLCQDREIVGVRSGETGPCLGLAVDLGTTTVVALLLDLKTGQQVAVASDVNPQVSWGDDVISRISYCAEGKEAAREMADLALDCVNSLAEKACREAGADLEDVYECTMVGNTAMHHIFLGLEAAGLARAPYAPVTSREVCLKAREIGLRLAPEAWASWLPVKAGFVGADIVAVLIAIGVEDCDQPTLIVDLGTNGEMVLAADGQLICCSAAAGPAFEGGHIRWGMRGAPGAVEKVRLHPETFDPQLQVIGGGRPKGLCGSGLVSLVSQLVLNGVLTSTGAFNAGLETPRLRQGEDGAEFVLAFAEEAAHGGDIVLTARDVASLQMAKAAIRAGSELLCQHMGLSRVEDIVVAGAFGNYLDPLEALQLGMFPDVRPECIRGVGNAAAAGAVKALADSGARHQASVLARKMVHLELSNHPDFHDLFVNSLEFPEAAEQV